MQMKVNTTSVIASLVLLGIAGSGHAAPPSDTVFMVDGVAKAVRHDGKVWTPGNGYLECGGTNNYLYADGLLGTGDFHVSVKLAVLNLAKSAATFVIGSSHFGFEGGGGEMFTEGPLLGRKSLGEPVVREGKPFLFEAIREGDTLRFLIDGNEVHQTKTDSKAALNVGLRPWRSTMRVTDFSATGNLIAAPEPPFQFDVFVSGTEGYHTFRIPAIVTTARGTILAICEGRKGGGGDSGDIDIVLKRSADNGQTWSELQVVADHETNTIGNPCPVVDRSTGRIWLPLTWNLGTDHERQIMAGTSEDVRRVYITYSDDDGVTWAPIKDISDTARQPHWRWYATGPGTGIQLTRGQHKGRLVIPANHSDHSDPNLHPYRSHVLISDDHGETWKIGGILDEKTNESTVVELADGRLLENMRSYHGKNRRAVATSDDGGQTWSKVTLDETLIEPVCQANVLRHTFPGDTEKSRILFSNPASTARVMMTVRTSCDEGQTWPVAKLIHAGSAAYSCMTVLPDKSIGLFYERDGYKRITFARFDLEWLTPSRSRLPDGTLQRHNTSPRDTRSRPAAGTYQLATPVGSPGEVGSPGRQLVGPKHPPDPAKEPEAFNDWQRQMREQLRKMLGIPEERVPLEPETRGSFEVDGIVVEKWVFTSEPGSRIPAVLYRPKDPQRPMPAVVLTFGHGGSKSHLCYNYLGQLYARIGVACLAMDPIGEEERHRQGRMGTRAHDPASVHHAAWNAGRPIMGKLVFDTMRGIDFLLARDDIDSKRIGVAGNSLGGAKAGWMAALDTRLRFAIVSGWAFDDVTLISKYCTRVPNEHMRKMLSWSQYVSLAAPHCALLVMNGDADVIIDRNGDGTAWRGTRSVIEDVAKVYAALGAPGAVRCWFEPSGGHRPYPAYKAGLEWIVQHAEPPGWTIEKVSELDEINFGRWADANGITLERLYGTDLHLRGASVADSGISYLPREKLAVLKPDEMRQPQFTIEGWLQQITGDSQ
ncbi:MAG: exo-alpha-sialidase [Pirellulaceae bacterium]|nr:exo-alpha-sialidase [Pirellulaceae bacterium]